MTIYFIQRIDNIIICNVANQCRFNSCSGSCWCCCWWWVSVNQSNEIGWWGWKEIKAMRWKERKMKYLFNMVRSKKEGERNERKSWWERSREVGIKFTYCKTNLKRWRMNWFQVYSTYLLVKTVCGAWGGGMTVIATTGPVWPTKSSHVLSSIRCQAIIELFVLTTGPPVPRDILLLLLPGTKVRICPGENPGPFNSSNLPLYKLIPRNTK